MLHSLAKRHAFTYFIPTFPVKEDSLLLHFNEYTGGTTGGRRGAYAPQTARGAEGWGVWPGRGADSGGRHAMLTLSTWPQLASKVRRSDILCNSR